MQESSTKPDVILQFRQDVERQLRHQIRQAVEMALNEELAAALASGRHERSEARRGYRHGTIERRLTTGDGLRVMDVPRGRLVSEDGTTSEFRSTLLPRYARRTRAVDDAILRCYLAGVNSRRIRTALQPLLGAAHLSKSAVSRVVSRLKTLFTTWQERELASERYPILFLDGFHLKVRLARRVVAVPILAVLGVTETGQKRLVALQVAVSEAATLWNAVLSDLHRRGLAAPRLLVVDGHAGLKKAREVWPDVQVQRCTTHKWRNLEAHARSMRGPSSNATTTGCSTPPMAWRHGRPTTPACGSGRRCVRRSRGRSKKPAASCSPSTPSRRRCGRRCGRPTRSRTCIASSVAGRRRRRRSVPRPPHSRCFLASWRSNRFTCDGSMAISSCRRSSRRRNHRLRDT